MSHPYLFPFFLPCFALAVPTVSSERPLQECRCQKNAGARAILVSRSDLRFPARTFALSSQLDWWSLCLLQFFCWRRLRLVDGRGRIGSYVSARRGCCLFAVGLSTITSLTGL